MCKCAPPDPGEVAYRPPHPAETQTANGAAAADYRDLIADAEPFNIFSDDDAGEANFADTLTDSISNTPEKYESVRGQSTR